MKTFSEVENKYDVGPDFLVPDPSGVGEIASVDEPHTDDLVAVYYDTDGFRLARNRIVLRRRTGGSDAGWHLKLPAGSARTEIRRPLGRGNRPPADLADLVFARTRGLPLSPVARLSTNRTTYVLRDAEGNALAELADDRVHGEVFAAAGTAVELSAWREVEVELVGGGRKVLRHAGRSLVDAGAAPSTRPSKLGGLLGDRVAGGPDVQSPPTSPGRRSSARCVVQAYLLEHVQRLLDADLCLRLDEPESIHDMRVASRRIRSSLKTFRRLLDGERARDLEDRLRDLGVQLGVARDSEVLLGRLLGTLDELPMTYVLGPVRRRLQEQLHGGYLRGRGEALEFMGSGAYATLLDDLLAFVGDGFDAASADQAASKVLPKLVRRSVRKVNTRVALAQRARQGDEHEHALHQVRKAAKQARYAGEAARPALGSAMARLSKQAKEIQEILGEHQDSIVAIGVLRDLGPAAHAAADESSFTFGLLAGLERAHGAAARRRFEAEWKPLRVPFVK
jgi:CHAD domain-containing protein